MSVADDAALWLATATPADIRAFALFAEQGCPSCNSNVSPGCACREYRLRQFREKIVEGETS